jgi:hypothetical protein
MSVLWKYIPVDQYCYLLPWRLIAAVFVNYKWFLSDRNAIYIDRCMHYKTACSILATTDVRKKTGDTELFYMKLSCTLFL